MAEKKLTKVFPLAAGLLGALVSGASAIASAPTFSPTTISAALAFVQDEGDSGDEDSSAESEDSPEDAQSEAQPDSAEPEYAEAEPEYADDTVEPEESAEALPLDEMPPEDEIAEDNQEQDPVVDEDRVEQGEAEPDQDTQLASDERRSEVPSQPAAAEPTTAQQPVAVQQPVPQPVAVQEPVAQQASPRVEAQPPAQQPRPECVEKPLPMKDGKFSMALALESAALQKRDPSCNPGNGVPQGGAIQ